MKLPKGIGSGWDRGCWMAAVSIYANEIGSDHPSCVPPTIRWLCFILNDMLPSDAERERVIGPVLFLPVGADPSPEAEQERVFLCADRAVRVFAPKALDAAGMTDEAQALRDLQPVTNKESAHAARAGADAAGRAANAAGAADAAAVAAAATAAAYAAGAGADAAVRAANAVAAAVWAADAAADAAADLIQLIVDCCRVGQKNEADPERVAETLELIRHW